LSLECLGYNQPPYADPADRDANDVGNRKAFLVAYEQGVANWAKRLMAK
jgi:hypothetical protein